MNPLNYGSLEASKRLVEAGIVLETEAIWRKNRDRRVEPGYYLTRKALYHRKTDIPSPCMAEVWRELPPQGCYLTANQGYYYAWIEWTDFEGHGKSCEAKENTNPTDALIDLLIWVRKEASNDHT